MSRTVVTPPITQFRKLRAICRFIWVTAVKVT